MTNQTVTMDDGAPAPSLSPLERLKLSRELATVKTDLSVIAAGPAATLTRLKLVARANQIRARLGGGANLPAPEPKPEPKPEPTPEPVEHPGVAELREVIAGQHDGLGLDALLSKIEKAAHALHEADALAGEAESVAQDAVTHWARLELQTNG